MKRLGLILLLAAALTLAACNGAEQAADNGPAAEESAAEETAATAADVAAAGETAAGETLGEARDEAQDEALNEAEDEAAVADAGWDGSGLSAGGLVFMVPATDEVLAPYDDFDVFNYDPGVQPLLFYTERDVPNFRLVSVTMENDGGELVFRPDQLLYQRNWLNPERPSLIQILPQGDVNSGFGITFTDPEDPETEHFYILSPTGRGEAGDPPLVFTEIY